MFVPERLDAAMVPAKVALELSNESSVVPLTSNSYLPLDEAILKV